MKMLPLVTTVTLSATTVLAQEASNLGAHEHGVGELNIAFEGQTIAMELHASGADIVGFEYVAKNDVDIAAVEKALDVLGSPMTLFGFSPAAGCAVVEAAAEIEGEEGHEDHKEGHDDDEEGHDDHDEDHEEGHEDENYEEHQDEAAHSEFHAEYLIECADVTALTAIAFPYFDVFPNAQEIDVQMISDKGSNAAEVERGEPQLDLEGKI